ncbi:MAG TPA: GNAT family N-acetyltransferase [Candidatus Baltobacteraceae bacterium]|nr:GNAT family N-acetyltransferase [Candidatus Baltobacteraceae bacterium]
MNYRLVELSAHAYAAQVLPLTESLWAYGRSSETYAAQTTQLAVTPYGRKSYRTIALSDGSNMLATFKRYEREARAGAQRLRAIGIGAVFTPQPFRGHGFATAMLGMALDDARAAGIDFAFLFSDIHPQFYKELGFVELASRSISVRADSLAAARIDARPIDDHDWSGLRACFDAMELRRDFALVRTPAVWNWVRTRLTQAAHLQAHAQQVNLVVRRGRSVAAYVLGRREPRHDAYVVDEFAAADGGAADALVPAVLRIGAGDLRRIAGWLPPMPARDALPRGSVRKRNDAVWMIAPLSRGGNAFVQCAQESRSADGVWSQDRI